MALHKSGNEFDYLRNKPTDFTFDYKIPAELIKDVAINMLKNYMLSHEDDIALGTDDFDELRHPFEVLICRQAESKDHDGNKIIDGKRVE